MEMQPLVKIQGLSKRYGKNSSYALQDINLTIYEGEFIAILGPSGAGKSTLIRCLNRLVQPTQGHVLWAQDDILRFTPRQLRKFRQQVGMIFQNFNLVENMSVLRNVLVGSFGSLSMRQILLGRYPDHILNEAREALNTVGMDDLIFRRVRDLSGGQRQRVAVARALVQRPSLILGDEPVASLDPVTARTVLDLLNQIRLRDTITMIVNLHSVELAKTYATRVIGICNGQVVFDGPPSHLNENIQKKIYLGAK